MLTMDEPYIILEEKMTKRLDNPASIDSHSSRPTETKSQLCQDDSNQGIMGNYDRYTP